MILRLKFHTVTFPLTITKIDYASVDSLSVTVNGTPISLVDDLVDGDVGKATISMCIGETKQLQITAQEGTSATYSNNFEIYGYDLGNASTEGNYDFNIYLVQSGGYYTRFSYIRKPFSPVVYVYDVTSSIPVPYTNDPVYTKGSESVYSRNYSYSDGAAFSLTMSKNGITYTDTIPIRKKDLAYPVTTAIESNLDDSDSFAVYNTETTNDALAYPTYVLDKYNKDGSLVYGAPTDTLVRTLYDYQGNQLDTDSINITDMNIYSPTASKWTFDIPDRGDYVIKTELISKDCNGAVIRTYTKSDTIVADDFIRVTQTASDIVITNYAFEDAEITVEFLEDDNTWTEVLSQTLTSLTSLNYTVNDGVYRITATRDSLEDPHIFIIVIYNQLSVCIKTLLDNLICVDLCENSTKSYFELNSIVALSALLFAKLQNMYLDVYYYTALEDVDNDELYTINDLLEKLALYCYKCNDATIISDCGCF